MSTLLHIYLKKHLLTEQTNQFEIIKNVYFKGASGNLLVTDYAVKKSVNKAGNGRLSKDNRSFSNEAHDFLDKQGVTMRFPEVPIN